MAKRRLSAGDFDLERGTSKDARTLQRFLAQEGAAGRAVIDEALARGGPKVKEVAWLALVDLDLPGAEARALAATEGAEAIKKQKDRALALAPLQCVATSACLDRLAALGVEVQPGSLPPEALNRARPWGLARLLATPEPEEQEEALEDWFLGEALEPESLALLRGALDHPSLTAGARQLILAPLIEAPDRETCRRDDLPEDFVIAARFALPPAEAFERLRPFFEATPARRDELIRALAQQDSCDSGWVDVFSSLESPALRAAGLLATRRLEALRLLAPLIKSLDPGPALLEVLTDLRGFDSPEAAELIVPWLERSELDGNAALLATSLRACGTPEHVPALEAAARRNPGGAMFYLEAVGHIQARHAR